MDICDFHAHILPALDHGTSSVEESLAQLRLAADNGVGRIVATSHFYPESSSVATFVARRSESYRLLCDALTSGLPEIKLAAEVLLCPGMHRMEDLSQLCIDGSSSILIELPFNGFGADHVEALRGIISLGYDVVLAHADRYDPVLINSLLPLGCRIQLNASALSGLFVRRHLRNWCARGSVVAIGSDIHGADRKAYRRLVRAVHRLGDYAEYVRRESDAIWYSGISR